VSEFGAEPSGPTGIDIIIPVYRNAALTAECLKSVAAHLGELAAYAPRLLLINDSPDDAEVSSLLRTFAGQRTDVRLIENAQNQGFIRSVNSALAIARADGRDVILVNADTQTFEGTLIALLGVAYSDPQIAFVSPRSNNASLCTLPHVHGGVLPTSAQAHARWKLLAATMPAYHFVPTAVGFYLYIKHAVLSNFGPLDTQFGAGYEEENDLIMRANRVGYRAAIANHAFAYHAGSASFSLTNMDLSTHRHQNLIALTKRHPEFLPLVRRYEDSPHFRAEALLGQVVPASDGRYKLAIDLSSLGCNVNGTSEQSVATVARLCARHRATFEVNVVCSEAAFKYHAFDRIESLRRHEAEPLTGERFALAVRIGQPFELDAISTLEKLAPINVYGMLDTIAEDCGYLSVTQPLEELWRHVARHSNGLFFISRFSEQTFLARFPEAQCLPRYARLLPTRLAEYQPRRRDGDAEHVLIMGNHFAHKASLATAQILRAAFPTVQFVMLGKKTETAGNLRSYQSGMVAEDQIEAMYARASVVVLPSYVEGFGFGMVRALAAGKAVVARDIPPTREILAKYRNVSGVFLYRDNVELVSALQLAITLGASRLDDAGADNWDDWVDGLADYCRGLLLQGDLFPRLVERLRAGDLLRRANAPALLADRGGAVRSLRQLLAFDGEEFVRTAYLTVLNREVDSDGLENYLAELKAGISKFTIVARLRRSQEGQQKSLPLAGFRRAAIARRLLRPFDSK
jgi:GT2 family glycosyltransferase